MAMIVGDYAYLSNEKSERIELEKHMASYARENL